MMKTPVASICEVVLASIINSTLFYQIQLEFIHKSGFRALMLSRGESASVLSRVKYSFFRGVSQGQAMYESVVASR